jgi:hypothetical protein
MKFGLHQKAEFKNLSNFTAKFRFRSRLSERQNENVRFQLKRLKNDEWIICDGTTPRFTIMAQYHKLHAAVIYEILYNARVFAPGRPFQPIVMLVAKARSLPQSGPLESSHLGMLRPCLQTLD